MRDSTADAILGLPMGNQEYRNSDFKRCPKCRNKSASLPLDKDGIAFCKKCPFRWRFTLKTRDSPPDHHYCEGIPVELRSIRLNEQLYGLLHRSSERIDRFWHSTFVCRHCTRTFTARCHEIIGYEAAP